MENPRTSYNVVTVTSFPVAQPRNEVEGCCFPCLIPPSSSPSLSSGDSGPRVGGCAPKHIIHMEVRPATWFFLTKRHFCLQRRVGGLLHTHCRPPLSPTFSSYRLVGHQELNLRSLRGAALWLRCWGLAGAFSIAQTFGLVSCQDRAGVS